MARKKKTDQEKLTPAAPVKGVPTLRLDFIINDIGYQADIFHEGEHIGGQVRDFGGTYPMDSVEYHAVIEDLYQRLRRTIDQWRRAK